MQSTNNNKNKGRNPRKLRLPQSKLKIIAVSVLALGTFTSLLAYAISISVAKIDTLDYNSVSGINVVAGTGQTDAVLASGTINSNSPGGWILKVMSANKGKLTHGSGGPGNEIVYGNVKMASTGGTLGATLTNPSGVDRVITSGTAIFDTGVATTATVDYKFELQVSWPADPSILGGRYTDTITLLIVPVD
jgi:hypothetical protein|tara:strand:- start:208 stop:780 length:573 start_codon:yes stop_codon:yes gene_type:complete